MWNAEKLRGGESKTDLLDSTKIHYSTGLANTTSNSFSRILCVVFSVRVCVNHVDEMCFVVLVVRRIVIRE